MRKRIQAAKPKKMDPGFIDALEFLAEVREDLHLADKGKLSIAIHKTIKRIAIGRKTETHGGHEHRRWFGIVEFQSDVYMGEPILIEDDDLAPCYLWRRVSDYLTDEPVTAYKLAKVMGMDHNNLRNVLKVAEKKGRVRSVGFRKGWVVATPDARTSLK